MEPQTVEKLVEGKTKEVYSVAGEAGLVLVVNKDRITAGDGVKAHDLEGKAAISNATNAKVFTFLQESGETIRAVTDCIIYSMLHSPRIAIQFF